MTSRWPFYASVAVLGCACVACLFAGSIEWGERGAMVGIDSAEAAEQARFAIELYAIGALNMVDYRSSDMHAPQDGNLLCWC